MKKLLMALLALGLVSALSSCGPKAFVKGQYEDAPAKPFVPGYEVAGIVREVGAGERFAMGDRYEGSERFRLRHFFCPGCATQVDGQIALADEPVWENMDTQPAR